MRYALIALVMASSPALAADCGTFTHESRPPGEVTATFDEGARSLVIADQYADTVTYRLESAGTGIAFMLGTAEGKDAVRVREHKGDLIVDMAVYEPFCE